MNERSIAVLAVKDVVEAARFYVDMLGFSQRWLWGEPPTFGCVGFGRAEIFLCQQPQLATQVEGHMHCFYTDDDVDALYAQHVAAGANVLWPIENKPWGLREYTVRDLNGYHLRFGGHVKYERPPTGTDALPPHIKVDVGLPDFKTYRDLFASVGWACHEASMREALSRSMFGIRAVDTRTAQQVGMTRVTGDGRNFVFWDVIVRPSHQGQKIGRAMMDAAIVELKRRGAPGGAFVGLFTGKPEFYESAGFARGVGMHRAL